VLDQTFSASIKRAKASLGSDLVTAMADSILQRAATDGAAAIGKELEWAFAQGVGHKAAVARAIQRAYQQVRRCADSLCYWSACSALGVVCGRHQVVLAAAHQACRRWPWPYVWPNFRSCHLLTAVIEYCKGGTLLELLPNKNSNACQDFVSQPAHQSGLQCAVAITAWQGTRAEDSAISGSKTWHPLAPCTPLSICCVLPRQGLNLCVG
jgi:hypothetical protein